MIGKLNDLYMKCTYAVNSDYDVRMLSLIDFGCQFTATQQSKQVHHKCTIK